MPIFANDLFSSIFLSGFNLKYLAGLEDNCLYIFSGYQTLVLHSKSVILLVLCLVLANSLFSTILLGGLRVNYSVNIGKKKFVIFCFYLCIP